MREIVKIKIENEMDLILAHKRSMKLAELCGLSLSVQTSFATAVSEVLRGATGNQDASTLSLCIAGAKGSRKHLLANISTSKVIAEEDDAIKYAKRLANQLEIKKDKSSTLIQLTQQINFSGLINDVRMDAFSQYFRKELPLSPYDELRKKNIQLLELSEKLSESENQYRMLTDTQPLMMFTTNSAGKLIYANKWLKDSFKLADAESGKLSWQSLVASKDHKRMMQLWDQSQISQASFKAEARLNLKSEPELPWHLISIIPILNEQGQLYRWTGFFVDIHAQKLIEETLKDNVELKATQKQLVNSRLKLEEKLQELNKSNHDLEQFAYIASHDLQEPLRKICNFTEMLDTHIDDREKAKKYLGKIESASSRMIGLIKDVLNYSRLSQRGNVFEDVDLVKILDAVKLDIELLIKEKEVVIITEPLPVIKGIYLQLYQLFYNLINNAIKFSASAPVIHISCREIPASEAANNKQLLKSVSYIELVFKDNGIGFDQKYAEQIFTIFQRLNDRQSYSGSGIGLALCKKIVHNHNGIISAKSKVGEGAEFYITLPVN